MKNAIKTVNMSEVYADPTENYSRKGGDFLDFFRDTADLMDLGVSIAQAGYLPGHGLIKVITLTPEECKEAEASRLRWIESLDADQLNYKLTVGNRAQVDKKSKETGEESTYEIEGQALINAYRDSLKPIKYGVVYGFRRTIAAQLTNPLLLSLIPSYTGTLTMPVEIDTLTPHERRIQNLAENTGKLTGNRALTDAEILQAVIPIYKDGGREVDITRACGNRGLAQKIYGILKADSRHPSAKLVKRLLLDPKDSDFVPMSRIHKESARKAETKKDVEALMIKKSSPDAPKPMASRADVSDLRDRCKVYIVKDVLTALLTKDYEPIAYLMDDELADKLNAIAGLEPDSTDEPTEPTEPTKVKTK